MSSQEKMKISFNFLESFYEIKVYKRLKKVFKVWRRRGRSEDEPE
jgi:hypothetical protein